MTIIIDETEQQIIQRLGTPKEFADSTAEQFGIDNTKSKKRNGIISTLAAAETQPLLYSGFVTAVVWKSAIMYFLPPTSPVATAT